LALVNVLLAVARLTFLSQISEIWSRFKLVGLKNLVGLLAFFRRRLKVTGLKKSVRPFDSFFDHFYAEVGSYEGKYCCSICLATHCKFFVINAIADVRITIFVVFGGC